MHEKSNIEQLLSYLSGRSLLFLYPHRHSPSLHPTPSMASALSTSLSPILPQTLTQKPRPCPLLPFTLLRCCPPPKNLILRSLDFTPRRPLPPSSLSNDATTTTVHFEDLIEKDWSFLDPSTPEDEWAPKARRIISAAAIVGDKSRVLVSFGTERFVDRLAAECPCELLLVIHDSLFVLAMIKEMHDRVRCWQGPIGEVPAKFWPLDVVFVCYFPGMGVSIDGLLEGLAGSLSPGARVVISFDQGREIVEQVLQKQYPDMVTSDLPSRVSLDKAATDHLFKLIDFVDDPTFYLAVLEFCGS